MAETARTEQIADRIVDAILARKLAPGARLGEQQLADLFGVSRTIVREALTRLAARGMVEVHSRRGWFVVQPSPDGAREAFAARQVIETGLLRALGSKPPRAVVRRLKQHIAQEQAAIVAADAGERSYLLGDFHVCLAECAGNTLLAEILKDLTARTTLIATLYQSTHDAVQSCQEHAEIVKALERGDEVRAAELMKRHIDNVARHLSPLAAADPLDSLREALSPVGKGAAPAARALHTTTTTKRPSRKGLFTPLLTTQPRSERSR